jgi:ribosome-associated heat shock protein Hsp15
MTDRKSTVRVDKWLWATRVFNTRTLAIESCKAGRVKVADLKAKPSREVSPGDIVTVRKDGMNIRLKVVAIIDKRVGAKTVAEYLKDLTPEEDYATAREHRKAMPKFSRSSTTPRPTRKERQAWEEFFAKENE